MRPASRVYEIVKRPNGRMNLPSVSGPRVPGGAVDFYELRVVRSISRNDNSIPLSGCPLDEINCSQDERRRVSKRLRVHARRDLVLQRIWVETVATSHMTISSGAIMPS